jgi:precorrin-6B methylase 2
MKTFDDYINEGKVNIDNLTFTLQTIVDRKGLAITFIPDSKTLDTIHVNGKNTIVDIIEKKMAKSSPLISTCMWFEAGHDAAGFTFRIDPTELTDELTKAFK